MLEIPGEVIVMCQNVRIHVKAFPASCVSGLERCLNAIQ